MNFRVRFGEILQRFSSKIDEIARYLSYSCVFVSNFHKLASQIMEYLRGNQTYFY